MILNRVLKSFMMALFMIMIATPASATTKQELEQTIRTLQEQYSTLYQQKQVAEYMAVNKPSSQKTPSTCTFTRPLTLGAQGADVTCLQEFLYPTYLSDKGNITGYFGSLTASAVSKWQQAHKVTPSTGYFGAKSQQVYQTSRGSAITDRNFEHYRIKNGIVQYKSYDGYRTLSDADASTFEEIGMSTEYDTQTGYGKDTKHVYRNEERTQLDPQSVKVFPLSFCEQIEVFQDKHGVWTLDWSASWSEVKKTDLDPASFTLLRCALKDKNGIYNLRDGHKISSDVKNYAEIEGSEYAKDAKTIYFRNTPLSGADLKTFMVMPPASVEETSIYAKDSIHVYWFDKVIEGADPKTFAYSKRDNSFATDKSALFYGGEKVKGSIDLKTFVPLEDDSYIKDKKHVYRLSYNDKDRQYVLEVLPNFDATSFETLGTCFSVEKSITSYAKDKKSVYVGYSKLPQIDVKTFQVIGTYVGEVGDLAYAKDKNKVYISCGEELKGADPTTFEMLEGGYAKDKKLVWSLGEVLSGVDRTTFTPLGSDRYGKDKNHIYIMNRTVSDVDYNSFEVLGGGLAKDTYHVYHYGEIVEGANPRECMAGDLAGCWEQN